MDELNKRLSPTECGSNVELTKLNTNSNSVELDPSTGTSKSSDYSRKLTERVQNDVEKLKDGSMHRHRYKLHELNENKDQLTSNLDNNKYGAATNNSLSASRLPSSSLTSNYSSRLREILDEDDDDLIANRRSKIKDYDPIGR